MLNDKLSLTICRQLWDAVKVQLAGSADATDLGGEQICAEQWLLTDPGLRVVTYAIREDALQLSLFGRRKGNRIVGEVARLQGALQDISGQPLPGFELRLGEVGVDSVALRVAVHRRQLRDLVAAEVPAGINGIEGLFEHNF